ncbi:nucleotidyltransferase [candidate division WOR-1 bacterium RIFOXYA2_FULL_36_21]|uniref:Nucleotidyltransferase n=1 Tax=candidate division WOR-1 bacterium RIFOXYB2_FULL_36_35 TaxID=1802578 RepID=A0A1F4S7F6_UNCSA|nr:MAG: nucleotidyltransferase [candidate division WOR-1 bacterium RIFOXYA2_FULL_36_21]OGC16103.1 MAG: nucleotidyltransferase [candidate division WOR-1 bacterium RIFOXYA12_FULL_36_13]OGC16350.1 MAG: nucleotidyltransferase [candidate division WOR-1 bacterium RIFOXYB2_FULL_36_35]
MTKTEALVQQFSRALLRLKEVLNIPRNDIVRDSAIQRFEFTLDLSWKALKAYLEDKKGIVCASPKECFREAYRQGIITYDEAWLDIVDMRNETSHTYYEKTAEEVFLELPNTVKHFEALLSSISNH